MRAARLLPVTLVALCLLALAGAGTLSAARTQVYYPLFQMHGDDHLLGGTNDLVFDLSYLSSAGETERVTFQTPKGFNGSLVHAPDTELGSAALGAFRAGTNVSVSPSAKVVRYSGSLVVMRQAAYAADTGAQACAPGNHSAYWGLKLMSVPKGPLNVPIAVDASRGGYQLTICFDALHAAGLEPEWLYFTPSEVFRNPSRNGVYLFDAVVTPFDGTGAENSAAAYEVRAYQVLPQYLTASPTYDTAKKVLTVTGKAQADGKPRKDVYVHILGARTLDATSWIDLGTTTTTPDGSYNFTKSFGSFRYAYVYARVEATGGPACPSKSAQPGGCASTSTDGRASDAEKILSS